MKTYDINAIREQLVQALSRKFDNGRKVSVYGAGWASALAGPCFEEIGGGGGWGGTPSLS